MRSFPLWRCRCRYSGSPHTLQAEEEEIKRAYRRLVLRLHPDRSASDPTANEAFQRVQEAYRVLRDGTLRAEHDKTLAPRLDVMVRG